jgi:hypothetical protein
MMRSRLPFSVFSGGASNSARACPSRERRRLSLIAFRLGAFDPAHRVVADRVHLAKVVKGRGDGGQFAPDGTGGQAP